MKAQKEMQELTGINVENNCVHVKLNFALLGSIFMCMHVIVHFEALYC